VNYTKIPPMVILGVGAFVILMSFISFERGTRVMFLIVGIGFLVYGIVRLFDDKEGARAKPATHGNASAAAMMQQQAVHHAGANPTFKQVLQGRQPQAHHQHAYATCQRCNAKIHAQQNFCHNCGTRLR